MPAFKNLAGQKFGRLTALYRDKEYEKEHNLHTGAYWRCKCECGKEHIAKGVLLSSGHVKSCGCLHSEQARRNGGEKDLTGQIFGFLTVLERDTEYKETNNIKSRHTYWKCQCKCGEIKIILGNSLLSGATTSCGKCNRSKGETKIEQLLLENNISFEKEKTFNNCKLLKSNHVFRFDFYINNQFLLEFDGIQHFQYRKYGWNTKENYEKIKKRDDFKNKWCLENNIPLKRIPYWDLDKITFEDIMSNKYLIKGE